VNKQLYTTFEQVGRKRRSDQKYVLDERGRRLMFDLYNGTSKNIDLLMRYLGVPRQTVKRWACELGLSGQREPRWTPEDEAYLERNLHRMSVADIAKKLGRTKTAVKLKAKRLGVNKTMQEGYTMSSLCLGLGCDHHKVERWLEKGWLKGHKRKTERATGDVWLFTNAALRRFIAEHPHEVDPRRFDWLWLVDVLLGGDSYGIGSLDTDKNRSEEEPA
jgi:hypothetical protein